MPIPNTDQCILPLNENEEVIEVKSIDIPKKFNKISQNEYTTNDDIYVKLNKQTIETDENKPIDDGNESDNSIIIPDLV